jgi:hypothetical protein
MMRSVSSDFLGFYSKFVQLDEYLKRETDGLMCTNDSVRKMQRSMPQYNLFLSTGPFGVGAATLPLHFNTNPYAWARINPFIQLVMNLKK